MRAVRAGGGGRTDAEGADSARRTPRNRGIGMLIITAYGLFAVSATARALYQSVFHFEEAPVAYLLSAFAALVYVVATLALSRTSAAAWRAAVVAVMIELFGVLGVGIWTLAVPDLFADDTVWSHFGAGYGYVPLVLPVIGAFWLWRHRPSGPRADRL